MAPMARPPVALRRPPSALECLARPARESLAHLRLYLRIRRRWILRERLSARYHSRYTAHGFVSIQEPTAFNPQTHEMVNLGQFQGLPIEQRTQSMLIKNEALLFTRVLQNPGQRDSSDRMVSELSSPRQRCDWHHRHRLRQRGGQAEP